MKELSMDDIPEDFDNIGNRIQNVTTEDSLGIKSNYA